MYAILDNTQKRRDELEKLGYKGTKIHVQYFPSFVDYYALTMSVALLPVAVALWCVVTVVAIPAGIMGKIYVSSLPRPYDRFEGPGFVTLLVLISPFSAIIAVCSQLGRSLLVVF